MKQLILCALLSVCAASGMAAAEDRIPRDQLEAKIKHTSTLAQRLSSLANSLRVQGRRLTPDERSKIDLWLEQAKLYGEIVKLLEQSLAKAGKGQTVVMKKDVSARVGMLYRRAKKLGESVSRRGPRLLQLDRRNGGKSARKKTSAGEKAAHMTLEMLHLEAEMHEIESAKHRLMARIKQMQAELLEHEIRKAEVMAERAKYAARLKQMKAEQSTKGSGSRKK